MTREQLLQYHEQTCAAARALMERKNHDYTGTDGGSPFANFERSAAFGLGTREQGLLVRLIDKVSRMATFAQDGKFKVKDENVDDTVRDLVNYAILFGAMVKERQEDEKAVDAEYQVKEPVEKSNLWEVVKSLPGAWGRFLNVPGRDDFGGSWGVDWENICARIRGDDESGGCPKQVIRDFLTTNGWNGILPDSDVPPV